MKKNVKTLKIIFYGGRQAGMTALLTLIGLGHEIVCVIPVDEPVESIAKKFHITIQKPKNINDKKFFEYVKTLGAQMIFVCHGRWILKKHLIDKFLCVNLHPCLYKYRKADPIQRLLADKNTRASVASHWMIEEVDMGKTIVENFKEITAHDVIGVYNELYPLYAQTVIDTFEMLEKSNYEKNS